MDVSASRNSKFKVELSLRVNTSIGEAIAVGALEHPTEGLLLVKDLEGRKKNVRERDLSSRFTGNEGASHLANPWHKKSYYLSLQRAVPRSAIGILSRVSLTA